MQIFAQQLHPLSGHVNSSLFHVQQAPCTCSNPDAATLLGIPDECQWFLLKRKSNNFAKFPAAGKGRFRAYSGWSKLLGIWGIRVKPPLCVLDGVIGHFGPSSTGFITGSNPCKCETCRQEVAQALYALENPDSSDSESDGEEQIQLIVVPEVEDGVVLPEVTVVVPEDPPVEQAVAAELQALE